VSLPRNAHRLWYSLPLVALAAAGLVVAASGPAGAGTVQLAGKTTLTVNGHGIGHGHGLSQWGARGAALSGRSTAAILAFYYPHTALLANQAATVRVRITDDGTDVQIKSGIGVRATGVSGYLPTTGVTRYRLLPSATAGKLDLQLMKSGHWTAYKRGLPGTSAFTPSGHTLWLYTSAGARRYRGSMSAIRVGSSVMTVNRLSLEYYVDGVVPNEMPGSWPTTALRAQAIAVRSYTMNEIASHRSASYDICDSTQCQVYGGYSSEQTRVNQLLYWVRGKVLTSGGRPIFAQYSADDGGYTADGGQPYLAAQADPFEAAAGSPWLDWTRSVPVSRLAVHYGLSAVTSVTISHRDGNGSYGGRVLDAVVHGTRSGNAVSVSTSGYELTSALGVPNWWFRLSTSG
jgi:stage II sporulation protein D